MAYKYKDYEESDRVRDYSNQLANQEAQKPAEWNGGSYGKDVQEALNKVLNRDRFSYDLNGDMLYKQYKDQYQLLGQNAMMDTIGQASALTGGYGNSYAQNVGQQAYQGYLQKLNDIVPQLYGMAYDRYNQEGQDLKDQYSMLAQQDDIEYGRYRDALSDWQNQRNYLADMYQNERNFDYGKYGDDRTFDFSSYTDDRNYNYQLGRDAEADRQWQANFDEGVRQYENNYNYQLGRDAVSDAQWQQNFDYGKERDAIADAQWQAEFNEAMRQYNQNYALNQAKLAASGSGSGKSSASTKKEATSGNESYDNWKLTESEIRELQKFYGLEETGKWTESNYNKLGGKTAADAWNAYNQSNSIGTKFTGTSYKDAKEFLDIYGSDNKSGELLTPYEFDQEKKGLRTRGTAGNAYKQYGSYEDYLKAFVLYATE